MKIQSIFVVLTTAACLVGFAGCKQQTASPTTTPATSTPSGTASEQHDHPHSDGDAHAHSEGPHHGIIADWGGGKYHVEFTVDHSKQQATVYVLGSDEKTPTPIDATSIELSVIDPEMQVTLQASPQEGDSEGKASRFIGTHEKLGVAQEYAGTMSGVVDGTPYAGDFKEEPHGDHDH
jgi:hypothetical protein